MKTTALFLTLTLLPAVIANEHDKHDEDIVTTFSETKAYSSLWAKYAVDGNLNPLDMDIEVEDKTITLKGTVDTHAEKQLAGEIAESINGITQIHNHLVVDNDGTKSTKEAVTNVGDKLQTLATDAKIETRLAFNKHVMGNDVDVTVKGDKAILSGVVDSKRAFNVAEAIAKDTSGIEKVVNNITLEKSESENVNTMVYDEMVRLSNMAEDSWVETKVETELLLSNAINATDMDVEVVDGLVILTGTVPTDTQRDLVEKVIEDVIGVEQIENRLNIS